MDPKSPKLLEDIVRSSSFISVEPLKKLHERWHRHVEFVDVLIRQAHPGPGVRPYAAFDEKMQDALRYRDDEQIPWPVLADDL